MASVGWVWEYKMPFGLYSSYHLHFILFIAGFVAVKDQVTRFNCALAINVKATADMSKNNFFIFLFVYLRNTPAICKPVSLKLSSNIQIPPAVIVKEMTKLS